MNPGLPGLGIGGLFYILSALAMPLVALIRAARLAPQSSQRWWLAAGQCVIALAIIGSMAVTFWALDVALATHRFDAESAAEVQRRWSIVRASALAVTAGSLATVLAAMQFTRLLIARRAPHKSAGR